MNVLQEALRQLHLLPKETVVFMAERLQVRVRGATKQDYIHALTTQCRPCEVFPDYYTDHDTW